MNLPKVCIILLNWNGYEDTVECISSLQSLDYRSQTTIVVDNASRNNEAKRLEEQFPDVVVIKNKKNLGFSGGCNVGLEYAIRQGFDYALLLNNDTITTPDFLEKMVSFYESTPDAGLVSPLVLYPDKQTIWYSGVRVDTYTGIVKMRNKGKRITDMQLGDLPYTTDYAIGACALISIPFLKKIGGLDDIYFAYYEDAEWGYRTRLHGKESYVVPSAAIYHKKSAATGSGGKSKFTKIPAYYLARNGIIFSHCLTGREKPFYLFAQYTFKILLSLIFLVKPVAWGAYIRGVFDGTKVYLSGKTSDIPRFS